MKKQILAFVMAIVLILSGSSVTAFATSETDVANSSNSSVKEENYISNLEGGEFVVGDDSVVTEDTTNAITVEQKNENNSTYEENGGISENEEESYSEYDEPIVDNETTSNEDVEDEDINDEIEEKQNIEVQPKQTEPSNKKIEVAEEEKKVDLVKPENVAAKITGVNQVKITWEQVFAANNYEVYRSTKRNSGYKLLGNTDNTSYTDKTVRQGKIYYYKVVAKYNSQSSEYSEYVKIKCVLPAVSGLKVKQKTYNSIYLKWNRVKGATGYIIYRSTRENNGYKKIATTKSKAYTDKKLITGKKYYYKIVAYEGKINGEDSIVSVTLKPSKVSKLKASVSGSKIVLTWGKGAGASKYQIYRSTSKGSGYTKIATTTKLKYTDKKVTKGVKYYYRVYALKNNAKSGYRQCEGIITSALNYENMKAVWISYLDYTKLKDKSEKAFRSNIASMYKKASEQGLNTVIVHVRAFSDAVYPSDYYDWASFVTSNSNGPGYDPLTIMVEEAHKQKLSFHAWINPYRSKSGTVLDPASTTNINRIVNGVGEIVSNYAVDGIHFDDYFYASSDKTSQSTKMKDVNKMIKKVYSKIKSINKTVVFGISPAGEISYAHSIGCDVEEWLSNSGYVDYLMPQLYWSDEYENSSGEIVTMFTDRMTEWEEINENDTPLYVGMALYKVGTLVESAWGTDYGWNNADDNLYQQYKAAKEYGYLGYSLYRYDWLEKSISKKELKNLKKLN